ncbi:hypothetical protein [Mycolicibacterium sp. PDY-3]|uniref:hypothetical protein n=1 Tax=Mycolicibacterium sp. PDY-3 TaxID=3376069 RepID=UPI00378D049A
MTSIPVVRCPRHTGHAPQVEVQCGIAIPAFDTVARMDSILTRLRDVSGVALVDPDGDADVLAAAARVHSADLVAFLAQAWDRAEPVTDRPPLLFADTFAHRGLYAPNADRPKTAEQAGALGRYCIDTITGIGPDTYDAVVGSVGTALSAARYALQGAPLTVGLRRPPGHHVSFDAYGGGRYLNNAATTAQWLRDNGAAKVAIVDLDFHHGNGSQAIFYDRADVFYASLHGHPDRSYPYFTGYADETGTGQGRGTTLNLPFDTAITGPDYLRLAQEAVTTVAAFEPDFVVVSLGFDTYHSDPAGDALLHTEDYLPIGALFTGVAPGVVVLLEGGYSTDVLGDNLHAWLAGAAGPGILPLS